MANDINAVPSYNPADLETQSGTMNYILRCNNMNNSVCIPAIVESYDRKKHIVIVKPAITITATTGETLERESIVATVLSLCGAKFIINFPLEKGDTGWLITADRDISLFREQRKVINANTNRIHSIEDSFFIPDRVNDFKVEAEDEKNLVIQNLDRNIRISVAQDKIKITTKTKPKENGKESGEGTASQDGVSSDNVSSTDGTSETSNSEEQSNTTTVLLTEGEVDVETTGKVTVKAKKNVSCTVEEGDIECKCQNLTSTVEKDIKCTCENLTAEVKKDCSIKADGNANIKAPNIKLEGEVSIQGNVTISGNTDVSGTVTASEVIGGGKSLSSHIHQGVHGPTGGPQ